MEKRRRAKESLQGFCKRSGGTPSPQEEKKA